MASSTTRFELFLIVVEMGSKAAARNLKKLQMMTDKLARSTAKANKANISQQNAIVKAMQARSKVTSDMLKNLSAGLLGAGLAMLFFGMAVKNAAQGAIKSILRTYSTIMEGTAMYNQSLGRVSAAFEFLKFAIADAFLTSALGQWLIETLINIFDWVSSLNPELLKWIGLFLLVAFVVGTILMITGQLALALLGIVAVIMVVRAEWVILSGLFRAAKGVITKGIKSPFFLVLVIILMILAIIKIWNSDLSLGKKILLTVVAVFIILVALALLFSVTLTWPLMLLFALIAVAVALGIALMMAGDTFKLAFMKAIRSIGLFIYEQITKKLLFVLDLAGRFSKTARKAAAKVRGVGTAFDEKMSAKIVEMEAKIELAQAEKAEGATDEQSMWEKIKSGVSDKMADMTTINTGDIIMPDGTDATNFGANLTEEGQANALAGTG